MKPIELSDLQKSKLLEMCKDLFSQYYNIGFYSMQSNTLQISETKNSLVFIHWFEFCMTHLINKMKLKIYNYTRYQIENGKIHLIDYLYEQFKQLK